MIETVHIRAGPKSEPNTRSCFYQARLKEQQHSTKENKNTLGE